MSEGRERGRKRRMNWVGKKLTEVIGGLGIKEREGRKSSGKECMKSDQGRERNRRVRSDRGRGKKRNLKLVK